MELKQDYPLAALLKVAGLARSSFYYQRKLTRLTDKYAGLKTMIRRIFDQHRGRWIPANYSGYPVRRRPPVRDQPRTVQSGAPYPILGQGQASYRRWVQSEEIGRDLPQETGWVQWEEIVHRIGRPTVDGHRSAAV